MEISDRTVARNLRCLVFSLAFLGIARDLRSKRHTVLGICILEQL